MTKRYARGSTFALLALTVSLFGCDPNKGSSTGTETPGTPAPTKTEAPVATPVAGAPTYKVITNGISPFWDSMSKGLDQAKADLKVNGGWQGPQGAQHNEQVALLKDAIASKADGIAVSVIEADALAATIDQAAAANIPVITFDSDSPKSKRLAYIGTNNFEAGRTAGTEALKLFPNGGKLVAFVGNMSAQNARDRYNGFVEAIKGSKLSFVAEPFADNKDKGKARSNVEDAITKYPEVTGFVGLYSYNGPAIVSAVQAKNLRSKYKIICFDGEPDTLKNLDKGLVDVTVVQKPYEFGRLSVMLLNELHNNKGSIDDAITKLKPELDKLNMKVNGHIIDTGVTVVTPANAAPFLKDLKDKGLEST